MLECVVSAILADKNLKLAHDDAHDCHDKDGDRGIAVYLTITIYYIIIRVTVSNDNNNNNDNITIILSRKLCIDDTRRREQFERRIIIIGVVTRGERLDDV